MYGKRLEGIWFLYKPSRKARITMVPQDQVEMGRILLAQLV